MLANRMHRAVLGSVTRNTAPVIREFFGRSARPGVTELFQQPKRFLATDHDKNVHTFSSMAMPPGTVEKPLQILDMAMVRKIKAELMEVDANSDGR